MQNKNNVIKRIATLVMFAVSFLYFGLFRYWMIPSGDDYFWWGNEGTYLLHHGFYGPQAIYGGSSNGRYLGNLMEIITMHRMSLAVLAYAVTWTLLVWCIWRLVNKKSFTALLLSFLFVFTLQAGFINNVLAWNAGFVNYVPPMILVLLYIIFINWAKDKHSMLMPLYTLSLGLAAGLFDENITVASVVLGIFIIAYLRRRTRFYHVAYLVGAIISAFIMFTHRGYHEPSKYRMTTFDPVTMWKVYSTVTHFWLITFNVALLVAILLAIAVKTWKSDLVGIKRNFLLVGSLVLLIYYVVINLYLRTKPLNEGYGYNHISHWLSVPEGLISLLLITFIGYAIYNFYRKDANIWLYYLMTGIIAGQMLFVQAPLTIRGYFLTYVFMYLIALRFVVDALAELPINSSIVNVVLLIVLLGCGARYQYIIHANYQANLERVSQPSFYQDGVVFNEHVPYREFVWTNDLTNQQSPQYWKLYLEKHNLIK